MATDPTGEVAIAIPILLGVLGGINAATDVVNEEYGWAAFDAIGGALGLSELGVARAGVSTFLRPGIRAALPGISRGLQQAQYVYNAADVGIAFGRARASFAEGDVWGGLLQTAMFGLSIRGVASSPYRLGVHGNRAPSGFGGARLIHEADEAVQSVRGSRAVALREYAGDLDELAGPEIHEWMRAEGHHSVFKMLLRGFKKAGVLEAATPTGRIRGQRTVPLATWAHRDLHYIWDRLDPRLARGRGASDRIARLIRGGEFTPTQILDELERVTRVVLSDNPALGDALGRISSMRGRLRR